MTINNGLTSPSFLRDQDEVIAKIQGLLGIDQGSAEEIVLASKPLWDALADRGMVDGWGGSQFGGLLPTTLALLRRWANNPFDRCNTCRGTGHQSVTLQGVPR